MDRMIRNIDKSAYRLLKTQAASEGRTIGEVLSDAIRLYIGRPIQFKGKRNRALADLPVWDFGPGSEHWSDEVNEKGRDSP
jgi:hypothetical protein